jgi:uncharacterized repeat protein (TIGR01451 family)
MDAKISANQWSKFFSAVVMMLLASAILGLSASIVLSSPHYVKIDGWTPTTPLPQALADRNALVRGDYLYFIGGKSPSDSPVATIYSARIQAGGQLSAWNIAGQLPVAVYLHATAATETDLYVIGGWDGSKTRAEVWRAAFGANGTLGAFVKVGDYPTALDLHDAVIVQNRLYVVGGWTGNDPLNTVYYADLQPGGLGSWVAATPLPTSLYRLSATAHNNRIYVTGGFDNRNAQSAVYYATVQADGALGSWQATTELPVGIFFHETVIHDGQLTVLGGRGGTAEYDTVYAAPINANGSLGAWATQAALPESLHRFAAAPVTRNGSDFVYVIGGLHGGDYRANVYHSSYPAPPTPTATPTLTPTPTPRPETLVHVTLLNSPQRWVAPGEEIEYTIRYHNRSADQLTDVEIVNVVPQQVELLPDSIQGGLSHVHSGTQPGSTIRWTLGTVDPDGAGEVRYRVRRPLPMPPAIPRILNIDVTGPATAAAGALLNYSVIITNNTAFPVTNLTAVVTLPTGGEYRSGGDEPPQDGVLSWFIEELPGEGTLEREFTVAADHSLVLYDYYITSDEGPTAKGQHVLVTMIGETDPPPPGDGVMIANVGATTTWQVNGQGVNLQSNPVFNPNYGLRLPLISR